MEASPLSNSELRLLVLGEVLSAEGFEVRTPISVHFCIDLPPGWEEEFPGSPSQGATHSSSANGKGVFHFAHTFSYMLLSSVNHLTQAQQHSHPQLLFWVVGCEEGLVREEGYAVETLPSTPGSHLLHIRTHKAAATSITDKMKDVFLGISPAFNHPKFLHPQSDSQDGRLSVFGLETRASGSLNVRLRLLRQSEAGAPEKLRVVARMSSAAILRSVQTVIEAFERARRQAAAAKQPPTGEEHTSRDRTSMQDPFNVLG